MKTTLFVLDFPPAWSYNMCLLVSFPAFFCFFFCYARTTLVHTYCFSVLSSPTFYCLCWPMSIYLPFWEIFRAIFCKNQNDPWARCCEKDFMAEFFFSWDNLAIRIWSLNNCWWQLSGVSCAFPQHECFWCTYFAGYVHQYYSFFNTAVKGAAKVFPTPLWHALFHQCATFFFYRIFQLCSSSFSLIYAVFAGIL